jgi:hypothetical protein
MPDVELCLWNNGVFIMGRSNIIAMAAASAMAIAPAVAQAGTTTNSATASKVKRVGTAQKQESKLGGKNGTLVALAAAAAVVVAIILISDGPSSP